MPKQIATFESKPASSPAPRPAPRPDLRPDLRPNLRIDLKVCEGCGTLWVRAHAVGTPAGVYCRVCAERLASFPAPRGLRPARRPRLARLEPVRPAPAHLASSLVPHLVPSAFAAAASTGGAR